MVGSVDNNTAFLEMLKKVKSADGFLAALDQSGGSTPKALRAYGIADTEYTAGEESMFDVIHMVRTRIIKSPAFNGERILGAILFENTMDRKIDDVQTPEYLWKELNVVPFLKCDKGLAEEKNGVQVMKPMPDLANLLTRGKSLGCFGTKMRSVIKHANREGIKEIVDQQFEVGKKIIAHGLVPILEPEVDIKSETKEEIEDILKENILEHLNNLKDDEQVMLKLSLPTKVNLYQDLAEHPKVVRVVALSGGYSRQEANAILSKQKGMIASFSRALAEGLSHQLSDEDFNKTLDGSIASIFDASKEGN